MTSAAGDGFAATALDPQGPSTMPGAGAREAARPKDGACGRLPSTSDDATGPRTSALDECTAAEAAPPAPPAHCPEKACAEGCGPGTQCVSRASS